MIFFSNFIEVEDIFLLIILEVVMFVFVEKKFEVNMEVRGIKRNGIVVEM